MAQETAKTDDLYKILGLERHATPAEITAAFRRKAHELHPDHGGDENAFKALARAYGVLRDTAKRARYDEHGAEQPQQADNSHRRVLDIIRPMIMAALGQLTSTGEVFNDVIEVMRAVIVGTIANINTAIEANRSQIVRLAHFASKFSKATDGTNVIVEMIEYQIRNVERAIVDAEEALRNHEAALEFLKDYSFTPDVPPLVAMGDVVFQGNCWRAP